MRRARAVVEGPHFRIDTVDCADDHAGWSRPERSVATQIVLVRRGRFRLDSEGRELVADPTTGYLHAPGVEERFAHPAGGDVCTSITLVGDALLAGLPEPRSPEVRVDARLELAHRLLLRALPFRATGAAGAAAPGPDSLADSLAETVVGLLGLALRDRPDERPGPGRGELARRAREAVVADEPGSDDLVGLARSLETSPSHLSRTFRHHVGMTVSRYRNRVRVSRALSRIEEGETDLAALALGLGFSDQAHFGRVMRAELGATPGRVRELLGEHPPPRSGRAPRPEAGVAAVGGAGRALHDAAQLALDRQQVVAELLAE
ncbi:AraC family transcriptional regulator [Spirillospora sp. NPDC047279]|uniref:AraC family transcriptional regulator n=1 Tax=Spirillospora sp. NPDC047279 TaxID=3155478 RepID=UPI0033C5504C